MQVTLSAHGHVYLRASVSFPYYFIATTDLYHTVRTPNAMRAHPHASPPAPQL